MASAFGRGFITNLMHICKHFSGKPEEAFFGAADHLEEFIVPDQFRGTEIEELADRLRKRIVWHQPGTLDREEAEEVKKLINRLIIAIDKGLGIKDPDLGEFQ
ncbi:MAG TPA: hypothetical protein PK445_07110 [Methanolinea sp.]|jgi:hypothetical protein|nr:hypothetical protein [Methanolinea sp.]HOS82478.1 hypothetical protein [Methanolinea sp.]HPC55736.1 hypothetical protein [Methanolinea sp.]HQE86197.1 hypothetical protein [Methanolinea sp.]HQI14990.1 hypothetical protein [Methanolinea sp.]